MNPENKKNEEEFKFLECELLHNCEYIKFFHQRTNKIVTAHLLEWDIID